MTYLKLVRFLPLSVAMLLAPSAATALPAAGSNELRLENTFIMPGISYVGLNHHWSNDSSVAAGSSSATIFGFGMAYGRFVTDNVEIGANVSLTYISDDESSLVAPGLSPFLRLFLPTGPTTGIFAAGVAGFQYLSPDQGDGETVWNAGVDLGFEFFPTPAWSLRVGPLYRYLHESVDTATGSASITNHTIGLSWALAGYF